MPVHFYLKTFAVAAGLLALFFAATDAWAPTF